MRTRSDARRWVYCLPEYTTDKANATKEIDSTLKDSPPPTFFPSSVELIPKSATEEELEVSQQLVNTDSTDIQQPSNVGLVKNIQTVEQIKDTATQEFIQHTEGKEGERGYVGQTQSDSVLQKERPGNPPTAQSDHNSQQKAFQEKYQPVEVLNSDGEWVRGYWVHKCIVVANLAGIERKYSLVDEFDRKYVFWGEIRLPRGK